MDDTQPLRGVTTEHDYAIVRQMLLDFQADEWDVDDARHALQRIWYVMLKAGIVSKEALAAAIDEVAA